MNAASLAPIVLKDTRSKWPKVHHEAGRQLDIVTTACGHLYRAERIIASARPVDCLRCLAVTRG